MHLFGRRCAAKRVKASCDNS